VSAEANGNLISVLTMPSRILYSTNIVKGKCRGKRKLHFRFASYIRSDKDNMNEHRNK